MNDCAQVLELFWPKVALLEKIAEIGFYPIELAVPRLCCLQIHIYLNVKDLFSFPHSLLLRFIAPYWTLEKLIEASRNMNQGSKTQVPVVVGSASAPKAKLLESNDETIAVTILQRKLRHSSR